MTFLFLGVILGCVLYEIWLAYRPRKSAVKMSPDVLQIYKKPIDVEFED